LRDTDLADTPYEPGTPAPDGVIPLSAPKMSGNEWKYVKECLDTNWVSSAGPFVDRFERMVGDFIGAEHAVATVNGTAALHIALIVAGVQPDDEVLVSTLTFIAPVNAVRYVGAWPVFMDADPVCWQMDPAKVSEFLKKRCHWIRGELRNRNTGRRVKAIIPVHVLGHPVDMDVILEVGQKNDLVIVEDASESLGAKYKNRMAGHLADIGCLSFNGNKIITTGGGGMIVTDNDAWARKARYLTTQAKDDPIEYVHNEIGYNYRLTNVHAAIGVAQLERIEEFIEAKRSLAAFYHKGLDGVAGVSSLKEASWARSVFWLFTVLVDKAMYGMSSRELIKSLSQNAIQARPFWMPAHQQRLYKSCESYRIEVANRLYDRGVSLPSSVGITEQEMNRVVEVVRAQGYKQGALRHGSPIAGDTDGR
jgi:perosamine synthetase